MKTLDLIQNTPEWHAARALHDCASEAPAMMGASTKMNRTALLRLKATGSEREVSAWVQENLFDKGHTAEAAIRPHIEALIGEDLFASTGTNGRLLASFDGINMAETRCFEHKLWNEELAAAVRAKDLPAMYYWQLEHQLAVSEAEEVIFVVSDGTPEKCVHMIYTAQPGRREKLLAGWEQFNKDLAEFKPQAPVAEAVGRAPDALPALHIELSGLVKSSNLEAFKTGAIAVFQGIKTDLQTDQDFADADKTVKWCSEIEDKLKAAKQHALSQTQSIDELFRAIDAISGEARAKRLELEKLVKGRKDAVRTEIVQRTKDELRAHIETINKTLPPAHAMGVSMEASAAIAEAIRGKKTISSVQDAASTALAHANIETSAKADGIRANLEILRTEANENRMLFADAVNLCSTKSAEDLRNLISVRINEHRAEIERQAEEKRQREAAQKPATPIPHQAVQSASATAEATPVAQAGVAPAPAGLRIKLGDINSRIAPLSISAEGLASLGFHPVAIERAAKLYDGSAMPRICQLLAQRLMAVAAAPLQEAA